MQNYIEKATYLPSHEGVVWILDPGHGGMIDGKYQTFPNKMCDHGDFIFYEGVFNRQIVVKLAKKLRR
jgi:N-acetylmuramoyl-L-alanine amidase